MQTIVTEADLRVAILLLESKQQEEEKLLKKQFLEAYESVKPINLIKNTFKEATASPEIQDNLINSAIGILTGYGSKLIFQGATGGPVRKIIGTVLMFGIKNLVTQNPEIIKTLTRLIFKHDDAKNNP